MRFNYYQFPKGTPESILLKNGCAVILKSGDEIYTDSIPNDKRDLVDHISDLIYVGRVTEVKRLMRMYGGCGFTQHCERDGSLFEVTPIELTGNNSRFKYNHHL